MANYYLESVFQAAVKNSDGKSMKRFSMILDVGGLTYSQFASVEGYLPPYIILIRKLKSVAAG